MTDCLGASDYWLWAQRKKERVKGAALEEKGAGSKENKGGEGKAGKKKAKV